MKSAFTRRAPNAKISPLGTRLSAYNQSLLTSSGVASLDEVLGGGLPVGSILLLEPDEHSSYGDLVQKLFIAQGLSSPGHHVAVLSSRLEEGGGPEGFLTRLPSQEDALSSSQKGFAGGDDELPASRDPLKIAFRYEGLKSVDAGQHSPTSTAKGIYCSTFDLTRHTPVQTIERERVHLIDVTPDLHAAVPLHEHLSKLTHIVETKGFSSSSSSPVQGILRIAIQSFASSAWGSQNPEELYRFLIGLRHLLRSSLACAVVTLIPMLLEPALLRRLEHAADSVISLQSFSGRPDLAETFPRYGGLVHIKTLPALETLVPPSTRLSVLRGTSGKDDLAFRLKRRRFVVEKLHLDVEGGVNERRTPEKDGKPALPAGTKVATKADQPQFYEF